MQEFYKIIFVYGTLKKGCNAHHLLHNSVFLGEGWTKPKYELYGGFTYPALVHASEAGYQIHGEIYGADKITMQYLDVYEGVEYGLYKNEKIEIDHIDWAVTSVETPEVFSYFYYGDLKNFHKMAKWTCR